MQDPDARLRWMGPIVYPSDLCVPQTETHCLELPGRRVVMSQANSPSVSFLAGCSHHTRLNHSVQVADQRREWNTKETGKKNTSGGLVIWAGMKGVTFSVWQYRNTLFLNPNRCPLMGRVGPLFWYLDSNEELFADVLAGAGLHLPLNLCHSSPAP